ncbi:MAG: ATP-dependent helicase [Burkholderiaceae bacterium]
MKIQPLAPPFALTALMPFAASPATIPGRAVALREKVFAHLNAQQRQAVEHDLDPGVDAAAPLLVIAGAGSGKTLTLASRAAALVLAGADPQRLLLLTFSRRAAQEMQRRVGRALHQALDWPATQRPPEFSWAGTFHGVGARLLRDYARHIGLAQAFTIVDRSDAEDLMNLTRQDLGLAKTHKRFPQKATCLAIYSRVVNARCALRQVLLDSYSWCSHWHAELETLFGAYVASKQAQQVLDYDDLLLYWWQMMQHAELARHVGARFDHVLVDEYQDTNRLQAAILLALKPDGRGLTAVGDDAQAIYSFRAADVRNILDFAQQFQPAARVVRLERNYRSTQPILAASNAVIALAAERFTKTLWTDHASSERPGLVSVQDEAQQASWVADQVLHYRECGLALKSQAVLFRTSHHSAALELELTRRDIPFVKFGGLKFLEAAHIKDVLCVLRWAENPRYRLAGFRVAQLLPGVGPALARRLLDSVAAGADAAAALRAFTPPAAATLEWAQLIALLDRLRAPGAAWPDDLGAVNDWYRPHLERLHDDALLRWRDLGQLAQIAGGYSSRERFLTELTLDPPEASSDEAGAAHRDEDYLILSTIHSAKGQEWQCVFVLNVVDGCIPSDLATTGPSEIEEERRLLYVAMTRARSHLHLMVPQRFYVTQQSKFGDRHLYATLSRFIPPEVGAQFEAIGPSPSPAEDRDAASLPTAASLDLAAQLRAAWN